MQELFVPGHRSYHPRDNSSEQHFKANLGLYEEKIWRKCKSKLKRLHLQALRKEFETLEMKYGENVYDYFSRVMSVANRMRVYGE